MFDSRVLETGIGLVFFFLGVALITTAIQEFFASVIRLRAITLEAGLKAMIAKRERGLDLYRQFSGPAE